MQKNVAYGAYSLGTSNNEYALPQLCNQSDYNLSANNKANLSANNKAIGSSQHKLIHLMWGVTMVVAVVALIIAVAGVILGVITVRSSHDIWTLQQQLVSVKQELQKGEDVTSK